MEKKSSPNPKLSRRRWKHSPTLNPYNTFKPTTGKWKNARKSNEERLQNALHFYSKLQLQINHLMEVHFIRLTSMVLKTECRREKRKHGTQEFASIRRNPIVQRNNGVFIYLFEHFTSWIWLLLSFLSRFVSYLHLVGYALREKMFNGRACS